MIHSRFSLSVSPWWKRLTTKKEDLTHNICTCKLNSSHNKKYEKNITDPYFVPQIYLIWQNISSNKIFDTKTKFRQFCPIFAWLLCCNIGQYFRRTKCFVGQNFWHKAEILTILSDFYLTFLLKYWTKFLKDKTCRQTKFSTLAQNFDNFSDEFFFRKDSC